MRYLVDYLLCRTENREQANTPLMELHLTDEMVALLKSGRINNRLLCEIATNDKFEQLMTDTEIYIDGHATSTFRTLYEIFGRTAADHRPEIQAGR